MPTKERYRFFNQREIFPVTIQSKLSPQGLENILWEIQKSENPAWNEGKWGKQKNKVDLDNPDPKNIQALLKLIKFHPDNHRSLYWWHPSQTTVKTTLPQPVVERLNTAITQALEKDTNNPDCITIKY
jgi:hypothetical protein